MEFSITCTTCQAKLRVRDTSAIGQILTCPKCNSMVLIEAPAEGCGGEVDEASAAAPASATRPPPLPTQAMSQPPQPDADASQEGSTTPPVPSSDFADTVEDLTEYASAESSRAGADAQEDSGGQLEREPVAAVVTPPPPVLHRDAESLEGDDRGGPPAWLLATAAGATGLLLALAVFLWMSRGGEPEEVAQRQVTPLQQPLPASPPDTPPDSPPATGATESPETASSTSDTAAPSPATPAEASSESTGPAVELLPPTLPAVPDGTAAEPSPPPPAAELAAPRPTPPAATDEVPVTPARTAAPPGAVSLPPISEKPVEPATTTPAPPPLAPPGFETAESATRRGSGTPSEDGLAETLRKLGGLFDADAPETSAAPPAADTVAAPVADKASPDEPSKDAETLASSPPRPEPRVIDLAARLQDPIPEIEFSGTSLEDFLQFVGNYSTIPISLDPDVLMWLNLTPNSPISIKLRDTTVAQLLDTVLAKIGLARYAADRQLWVSIASQRPDGRRKVKLNVSDLVTREDKSIDDAQMAAIVEHIMELVAPGSWSSTAGEGSIEVDGDSLLVEHTNEVLFETIVFCEKLRVARGLAPRSKYDPKHFQLATRRERAEPVLAKPLTLTYARPTPFVKVLNRIAHEAGISLLVDWRAAHEAGWNTDAEITLAVADQPLSEVLDNLLQPMELGYRIVDETILQVTSRRVVDERLELEFYRLEHAAPGPPARNAPPPAILAAVPTDWLRTGGGTGAIRLDPASQCLLVSLPAPRQQAFEKLLHDTTKLAEGRR